ncbi:MAG: type VI secretion system tip protein VgrG [Polyangiaceae bacterium]|nr:type VI secretion system tip protein VgrG [Polyangiaceae bacterium]
MSINADIDVDDSLPSGSGRAHRPYELLAFPFPPEQFLVHAFRGSEAMSSPYVFDISVSSALTPELDIEQLLLGQRAVFMIRASRVPRAIHGVIRAVRSEGLRSQGSRAQHRLRLVPAFELLRHNRRSRIFQDMSVPEVVDKALPGLSLRWSLTKAYPKRQYITQYEESDRAFVERLLAGAGIFYYFAQPTIGAVLEQETVVFGDCPESHVPIDDDPTLRYLDRPGLAVERFETVSAFNPTRSVRPTRAEFREYDPDRPELPYSARAQGTESEPSAPRRPQPPFEEYEHHGRFHFPDWADAVAEPRRILARARRRAHVAKGKSLSTGLAPGHHFTLERHPLAGVNREYVVTQVRHRGSAAHDDHYRNTFECVPADVIYPPDRVRRQAVQAALTATVVGPPGEEIHVDEQGRIKVHFHWDREGGGEDSSCWIRTMQAWGGASWGAQFIPRVGMEVVIAFDGGDPDKPIVLGCVYNATHPMPFSVPGDKARSGIRTRTVHDSTGFNELSFRDVQNAEQVYLHAQHDYDEVVRHDHTAVVHHDERSRVDRDRTEEVGRDTRKTVGRNAKTTVAGDCLTAVEGSRFDSIGRDHHERVAGGRYTRIEQGASIEVGGPAELHCAAAVTTRIDGHNMTIVGRAEKRGSNTFHVEGTSTFSASGTLELVSEQEIVFRVGKSSIRLGKDRIDFVSAAVGTQGGGAGLEASKDGLKLSSDGAAQLVSKSLVIKTEDASMAMAKEVKLDGRRILLNAPSKATDRHKEPEPPTRIELVDQDGNPLGGERYLITLDDGTERSGVLGKDGTIELELLNGGSIRFPDLPNVRA